MNDRVKDKMFFAASSYVSTNAPLKSDKYIHDTTKIHLRQYSFTDINK